MMTPGEKELLLAVGQLNSVSQDMAEVKSTLKELTQAVNRLAVIEDRQQTATAALNRAFVEIAAIEIRVTALELAQPLQKQSSEWVQKAMGWILAAVMGAVMMNTLRPTRPMTETTTIVTPAR